MTPISLAPLLASSGSNRTISRSGSIATWLRGTAWLTCALGLAACGYDERAAPPASFEFHDRPDAATAFLFSPTVEGATCDTEGQRLECGRVLELHGDYATCSVGTRTCENGVWGECIGTRITQRSLPSAGGVQPKSTVYGSACPPGFDPCDPYCYRVEESPGSFSTPAGFEGGADAGLTPLRSTPEDCTSLSLTPSTDTLTVTDFSPLSVVGGPVTFTLTALPDGCAATPFAATWSVDKLDRAAITGSNETNGSLTLAVPIAGTMRVTAFAAGLNVSTEIAVQVNVLDAPTSSSQATALGIPTGSRTTSTYAGSFQDGSGTPLAGTASSSATWLYPYASTYFPLGLPAPVAQYRYSTTSGNGKAVKLSLRYPANSSVSDALFNYSIIVKEANNAAYDAGVASSNVLDPQVVIPQDAWRYFEQAARGADADLVVQRLRSVLERERRQVIHFVDGQLKGTVFYNSYTSPQGGNTGAVLSIAPGATSPTLAVQPSGKCTVCHSLNQGGSRLIANGGRSSNAYLFNQSRRYDLTTAGPSPTVLNDYNDSVAGDFTPGDYDVLGDRFTFGAPWTDGSLYMTHGGEPSYAGDHNWRAPNDYSKLYRVTATSTSSSPISVDDWSNVSAVTPDFSNDGTKLAFAFWGASSTRLRCSSNATSPCSGYSKRLSPDSGGRRLVVVDFTCSSPPCTGSSTDWAASNARDVTPGVSHRVGWPSFTPDASAVLYQRQLRTSRSRSDESSGILTNFWSPSPLNTVAGALAEIWMSDVPEDGRDSATPTRLLALNGLDSGCSATSTSCSTQYLNTQARTVSPVPTGYHDGSTSYTIAQADYCGNTGSLTAPLDHQMNYLPAVAPTETGGHHWVVFTSRRMYGNIAYDDAWDAEPGVSCSPSSLGHSGNPPTKKLWVAAIDKNFTPGTDPSHPAFYLPGQELQAGNSNGYWVSSQCVNLGGTCTSDDDCCGSSGDDPTTQCKIVSTSTVPPTRQCQERTTCNTVGETCGSDGDCCTGLVCPTGGGDCVSLPVPVYEPQLLEREYVATCPYGTYPKWRFFEWQASLPTDTSIEFAAQTKNAVTDAYVPTIAAPIADTVASTAPGTWDRGTQTTSDVLEDAGLVPGTYLRVSMTFNPDSAGENAPTLLNWRQVYNCLPAQ